MCENGNWLSVTEIFYGSWTALFALWQKHELYNSVILFDFLYIYWSTIIGLFKKVYITIKEGESILNL